MKKRVAVLISGEGTNLQALIDAAADDDYPAAIALVISNRPHVPGLQRAIQADIPATVIPHDDYPDRAAFEAAVQTALETYAIDIVCLAGFMRVLSDDFVRPWQGRMLNIHPSLLPKYKGLHTHRRALEAGDSEAGCTVHFVTPELDSGPIILQAAVRIRPDDTEVTLKARVRRQEHTIYPQALYQVAMSLR